MCVTVQLSILLLGLQLSILLFGLQLSTLLLGLQLSFFILGLQLSIFLFIGVVSVATVYFFYWGSICSTAYAVAKKRYVFFHNGPSLPQIQPTTNICQVRYRRYGTLSLDAFSACSFA